MPIWRRASRQWAGRPKTRASPSVIRIRLQTALISVVLPAPLGPSRPKKLPAGEVERVEGECAVVVSLGQAAQL
jgi:hypothetical protein